MPAKRTRKSYQNRRCAYCGAPLRDGVRTRDHVYPRSRGGTNRRGNLIPACRECNASKGDMAPGQWLASGKVTEVMRENGEYWRRRRFRRSLGV
ncbi:HNH endonuclease [Candidatus Poriferisodalis sp.]|uniref:HNH endonuclease n=1 Tax=Candidatus Poriferisodalis sp. TaxID=3101277 RepID=UPI003B5CB16D